MDKAMTEAREHIAKAARKLAAERERRRQEERDRRPYASLLSIKPGKKERREIIRL